MHWDYIIVGAGSAGCALAEELSRSGKQILILEAGGSDRSPYIKLPAGVLRAATRYDWGYKAEPDPSRAGAVEYWLRGKVVGGCSSINGTIYVRGAPQDFDRWAVQCGHDGGWSAREVLPLFQEMEASDQDNVWRGQRGRLHVRTVKRPHRITEAFVASACASGLAYNADYNAAVQEGVSYIQLSQRRGLRCSAADAFLRPLKRKANVSVSLNTVVQKVELHNGKAIAVNYLQGGKQHRQTGKDIILCAGSINSPKLLMLSGIGDPSELARHGIGLTLESPGVGRNLRDHPLIRMTYRMKVPTDNPTEGMLQKLRIAGRFLVNGEGPIANLFEGIAFAKSAATKPLPDLQLFFLTTGHINVPNVGWQLAPYPAVMVYAAASYPRSSGRLRLSNADPETPPLIEYSLFESQEDLETLVSAVGVIRRIMGTDPIGTMVAEEIVPGQSFTDSGKLEEFVRHNTNICYHSIGTCRMGRDSAAVVDCDLRVKGTINLWVADASVMPDPISANLNAPAMMIGKKLGKHLNLRSS